MTPPTDRFVAIVCYGADYTDLGVVLRDDAGLLYVAWTDGCPDPVKRDRRGWLIHEHGHHLPIMSRNKADAEPLLAAYRAAFEAVVGEPPSART